MRFNYKHFHIFYTKYENLNQFIYEDLLTKGIYEQWYSKENIEEEIVVSTSKVASEKQSY